MKSLWIIIFIAFSSMAFGQGMKIRWEDHAGREFSITAPSGELSYGMLAGDNISYDFKGRVNRVGDAFIQYDYNGRVNRVGDVAIQYDYKGKVNIVGSLMNQYTDPDVPVTLP